MERIHCSPRINSQAQAESLGFAFHGLNNRPYWHEQACYHFKKSEIEELDKATREIQRLALEVVDHVVTHRRYHELKIPEYSWPLIEYSWKNRDKSLYGRLDLSYSGTGPPKLLEYNADTPVCLLEAGLLQGQWLAQVRPNAGQFNAVHEKIIAAWLHFGFRQLHFVCCTEMEAEFATTRYLADTAAKAGCLSKVTHIENILWNDAEFVDQDNQVVNALYKLYAWEAMTEETFDRALKCNTRIIEPAWKMILSNKAFLVLLWEMFPAHPNLLPAYFESRDIVGPYVKKPIFGRQGANITLQTDQGIVATAGEYAEGDFIYQQAHYLPNFNGYYAVTGSWLVEGEPAGIIMTEETSPVTTGASPAVPHFFD